MIHCAKSLLAGLLAAAALPLSAADARRFELSVLVDGAPAPEYQARGRIYVEAIKGRDFELRLHNPASERVAVAISVDGRNVLNAKRTTALAATKFVLYPGQTVEIPGWQISGQTARRFFFTETSRSYAKWLGDTANVGTIEAVFFRERVRREPPIALQIPDRRVPKPQPKDFDEEGVPGGVSSGASGGSVYGDSAPASPQAARPPAELRAEGERSRESAARDKAIGSPEPQHKATRPSESDRFAATGIGERTHFLVNWIDFDEDPNPVARIALRYEFRPELVRLGVLPREDELYARDRARGFEREYAPDPHRDR